MRAISNFGFSHLPFNIKLHDHCWRQPLFSLWKPGQMLKISLGCWKAFDPHFGEHDADDGTIYLLVATTLLMKSAILMVTTDVVSSPAPQLSRIWPPIPFKVINWWLWCWLSLFTIKSTIVKFSTISHSKQTHMYIQSLDTFGVWKENVNVDEVFKRAMSALS